MVLCYMASKIMFNLMHQQYLPRSHRPKFRSIKYEQEEGEMENSHALRKRIQILIWTYLDGAHWNVL